MQHFALILILAIFSVQQNALAKITKVKPTMLFEGETITTFGTKYTSTTNPLSISLVDGEGTVFAANIEPTVTNPKGFKFVAPSVSSTKSLVLKISGGNVTDDVADEFPIVIFNAPDLNNPDPDPPDEDLNVENLNAESVITDELILNNRSLTSDANGSLVWNTKQIVNSNGILAPKSLVINGITLSVSNGDLNWNSHVVSKATGDITAKTLGSTSSANGKLTLNGSSAVKMFTSNGNATVYLPGSGMLVGVLRGEYDFAVDGGVVGSINLRNATLPIKARVTRAWYEVLTTFRSASDASQIGLSIPTDDANGILAPIAISDGTNPWDAGVHTTIQNGLVTNISEKTILSRNLQLTITGEALTAGKMVLFAEYMVLP